MSKFLDTNVIATVHGTVTDEKPKGDREKISMRDIINVTSIEENNNKLIVNGKAYLLDTAVIEGQEAGE